MARGAIRIPRRNVFDTTTLRMATVSEASRNRYQQSKASVVQRGFDFTVAGLRELLNSDCELKQMAQIKAALKHEMMVAGTPMSTTDDEDLNNLIKGRGRIVPAGVRVPGALTFKMVEQFLAWHRNRTRRGTREDWTQELEDAMWVHYGAALRASQLMDLTLGDLTPDEESGAWTVTVRRKGAINDDDRETKTMLEAVWPKMEAIVRRVVRRDVKNSRGREASKLKMFPSWNEARFAKLLKEAAVALNFGPTLRWSTHVARHGGLTDAMEIGGADYAQQVGGHRGGAEKYGYTLPNSQRVAKQRANTQQDAKRSQEIAARATKKRSPGDVVAPRLGKTRQAAGMSKRSRK